MDRLAPKCYAVVWTSTCRNLLFRSPTSRLFAARAGGPAVCAGGRRAVCGQLRGHSALHDRYDRQRRLASTCFPGHRARAHALAQDGMGWRGSIRTDTLLSHPNTPKYVRVNHALKATNHNPLICLHSRRLTRTTKQVVVAVLKEGDPKPMTDPDPEKEWSWVCRCTACELIFLSLNEYATPPYKCTGLPQPLRLPQRVAMATDR